MNNLIVGATGATGRLLTEELLNRSQFVKVIVRSPDKLPAAIRNHDHSHCDNEQAADYLRGTVGQNDEMIEWTAVRPDNLIDEDEVTAYDVHPSPIRSAIFDPGQTSRINVGHFMADLITADDTWHKWRGQMPVIYNKASQ